jgi:hypothetical protein
MNDVNVSSKSNKKKNIFCFVGAFKITNEKSRIPYSEVRGRSGTLVLSIRIRIRSMPIMMPLGNTFRISSFSFSKENHWVLVLLCYRYRVGRYRIFQPVLRIRIRRIYRYVFGSPGFGSISQRYGSGSGSFYHQAKIVRKTLIPTVL